jgi:hypothetical protein
MFNLAKLGHASFNEDGPSGLFKLHELCIHEFAHHFESNHLDKAFYKALQRLGAKLTACALDGRLKPRKAGFRVPGCA